MERPALVAIVGATGTGKSNFALDLAAALVATGTPAAVVNADAMQLYRGMDIGTAKLTLTERRGVPHHLLDVLDVREEASVAAYQRDARAAIHTIQAEHGVALLVGGSGLYVSAVLADLQFPGTDPALRARLEADLAAHGAAALHRRLAAADPETAATLDPRNERRLVRSLEVYELTGHAKAAHLPATGAPWQPHRVVHLTRPRPHLVPVLDRRVEAMWAAGLPDEVRGLLEHGLADGPTARRAIGYAQAIEQVRGVRTEADAICATQAATRALARRQENWWKRYADVIRLDATDEEARTHAIRTLIDSAVV